MRKNYLAEALKMRERLASNSLKPEIGSASVPSVWNSITTKMRCLSLRQLLKLQTRSAPNKLLVIAQGNSGWAYYETGDYARSLASFNAAAASAADSRFNDQQEHWLDTAGMSEARLGNLDPARERYDRALALARSLKNNSEIAQVDQALASLLLAHRTQKQRRSTSARPDILPSAEASLFDIQLGNLLEAQLLAQRGDLPNSEALLLRCRTTIPAISNDSPRRAAHPRPSVRQGGRPLNRPKTGFNVPLRPTTHNAPRCTQTIRASPSLRTPATSTWTTSPSSSAIIEQTMRSTSSTRAEQKPSPTGLDSETKGHHQPRSAGYLSPH